MASVLPTTAELATLDTLAAIRQWSGLSEPAWQAISACLGTVPSVRVFSVLPRETLKDAVRTVRIPPSVDGGAERSMSAVEIIQVALMWRVARQCYNLHDVDPLLDPPSPALVAPATTGPAVSPNKRVKMSTHVDQTDDTEVELISAADLDSAYRNYKEATGSDPLPETDPSPEQITVMINKILVRSEAPYADFSVMVPFGRRVQKQQKARNFLLQPDGSWKSIEIPGPPTYQAWVACWRVYRTVLLMIKHPPTPPATVSKSVATVASLEEYSDRIADLVSEFPECWHLIMQAEDRCRGEQFERYKRELARAHLEARLPMNLDFHPDQPWNAVFMHAARDRDFWDRNVVRPAQTFIARGGGQRSMTKKDAEMTQLGQGVAEAVDKSSGDFGGGLSKSAKRRKKEKDRAAAVREGEARLAALNRAANQRTSKPSHASPAAAAGSAGHPRKSGREFQTDREGNQICFRFAKGAIGACDEPCVDGRTHCCQYCLGTHPNSQCQRKPSNGGGKGSRK